MKKQIFLGIILGIGLSLIFFNLLSPAYSTNSKVIKHTFNNQLTLHLPLSTRATETKVIEQGQLSYSVYIDDPTLLIRGYIQLWKLNDLEKYLVDSQKISTFDFNSYTLKGIKVANFDGYLSEWTASFGQNYKISGMEYWLKQPGSDNVLRISFFTDTNTFTKEQHDYINDIIRSVNWSI
ncbi:hypothetical protein REC12_24610 [Desulfosporosinus sp. PR]|uniref:hypothetical protein n=1 Tax=Candidatus Desulfosporosinus nitrosoreducens TaxID=3401928 RepID=UPI0027EC9C25|nr:hypothetical protein [Desulfosporosinus sp. PR]MDQ7096779.1 hypothetical protein [Desulfosporosinus sp. PR]